MICRYCRRAILPWPGRATDSWISWVLAFEHPSDAGNRTYCMMGLRVHAPLTREQAIRELVAVLYS